MQNFPPEFYDNIPDYNFAFTTQCAYKIEQGLIYIKPLSNLLPVIIYGGIRLPTTNMSWQLQDDFGVPFKIDKHGIKSSLLSHNEYLIEIRVSGELITVRSSKNKLYFFKPTDNHLPTKWHDKAGLPFPSVLSLPHDTISWDTGLSVSAKSLKKRRTNFIAAAEIVEYSEDAIGTKHQFGFTYTVIALTHNYLIYTDTGLPGFTTYILLPVLCDPITQQKYIAQGQMISYAGSTAFLSFRDKYNNLGYATTYECYDIGGHHPGFTHDLIKLDQSHKPKTHATDEVMPLATGVRTLPFGTWKILNLNGIDPRSSLSSKISIHVIGQGNAARELRIIGVNEFGQSGYFNRLISGNTWQFVPAEFRLNYGRIPRYYSAVFNHALPNPLKNYACISATKLTPNINISLLEFNPSRQVAEYSIIRINHGNNSITIRLHLVAGWNSDVYPYDNLLRGSVAGIKKMSLGTLVIEYNPAIEQDPILKSYLFNIFGSYNRRMNAVGVLADEKDVYIRSKNGQLKLAFTRPLTEQEYQNTFYIKTASDPALSLNRLHTDSINALKRANEETLELLKNTHRSMHHHLFKYFIINQSSRFLVPIVRLAAKSLHRLTPFPKETCLQVASDAESLFYFQSKAELNAILSKSIGYDEAIKILTDRIEVLEQESHNMTMLTKQKIRI
jgi:hypothetical protein